MNTITGTKLVQTYNRISGSIKHYHVYNCVSIVFLFSTVFFLYLSSRRFPKPYGLGDVVSALGNPDRNPDGMIFFGLAFLTIILALFTFYRSVIITQPDNTPDLPFKLGALVVNKWGGFHHTLKVSCIVVAIGLFLTVQYPETWDTAHWFIFVFPNVIPHSVGAIVSFLGLQWILALHGGSLIASGRRTRGLVICLLPLVWVGYTALSQGLLWPTLRHCRKAGTCADREYLWVQWSFLEWIQVWIELVCFLVAITTLLPPAKAGDGSNGDELLSVQTDAELSDAPEVNI